jgi:integrating conjugative element protein (TIGR03765 family)
MKLNLLILLSVIFISPLINSKELILLYDTGQSTVFNKGMDSKIRLERPDPIKILESRFPIESKLWELASFESVEVKFPEMRSPVFLVDCGDISLGWVQHRKSLFEKNRALGFVINCPTYDDYTAFKAAIYPVVVQAANMDKLGQHLKHYKYPAYIHSRAIEQ